MRLPQILASKQAKKDVSDGVSIYGKSGQRLHEYSIAEFGNSIECFVSVSPGDNLILAFDIPHIEDQQQTLDIVIDGILRDTIIYKRAAQIHRGKVTKVCAFERRPDGRKGKLESCDMVVQNRNTTKDISQNSPSFIHLMPSAVGTIEVRILRKIPVDTGSLKNVKFEQAVRGATFEDGYAWWNLSKRVDAGVVPPVYEIGFFNGQRASGSSRKNIRQGIQNCYLWASFKFLYRSASDLQAAGFKFFKELPNTTSEEKAGRTTNLIGRMDNAMPVKASLANEKSFSASKSPPELLLKDIDAGISLTSKLGILEHHNNAKRLDHLDVIKEVSGGAASASVSLVDGNMTSVGYRDHGDSGIDQIRGSLIEDNSHKIGRNSNPTETTQDCSDRDGEEAERSQLKKRTPLPGSREDVLNMAEQRDFHDDITVVRFPGHLVRSSEQSQSFAISEKNHDCPLDSSVELAIARAEAAIHKPTKDQNTGGITLQPNSKMMNPTIVLPHIPYNTPSSLIRAKAGHYAIRSPLVAPDVEEMEGEADIKENVSKKRDFGDFSVGALSTPGPSSDRHYIVTGQDERGISPKLRREGHTRKRQAKREALEKAKAEAEDLRRQVAETEARQAEAIAREEAELAELDGEMQRLQQEKDALVARLLELNE